MRYLKTILACSIFFLTAIAAVRSHGQRPEHKFRISLSISPFTELLLRHEITFSDGKITAKNAKELQMLFVNHGANEVYARIATTQRYRVGVGDHSMDRGLERARIAKDLNLPFNPELGLFDIYGDIRCQRAPDFSDYPQIKLPGPWASLSLSQIEDALRSYGAIAARQILSTGVKVRIWDLGNEVEFGTAGVAVRPMPGGCDDTAGGPGWYKAPDKIDPAIGKMSAMELVRTPEAARIAWLKQHVWPNEAKLLKAAAEGIRSVDPQARFSTHVSGATAVLPAQAVAFYRAMKKGGFVVDEMGLSFYPTASADPSNRLEAFKETAIALQHAFGVPVFVAEAGYPAAPMQRGFIWNNALKGYPLTPQGQADFMRDLTAWGVRTGVLSGVRPWAPDIPGTPWAPMSFFDIHGKSASARPVLDAIAEGADSSNATPGTTLSR